MNPYTFELLDQESEDIGTQIHICRKSKRHRFFLPDDVNSLFKSVFLYRWNNFPDLAL